MSWHSPFDIYYWLVNVLAGSVTLFLALSFLVISALAGMFRMPTIITGLMFGLFIILLSVYAGTFYILLLFVIALIIGWTLVRLIK